MKIFDFNIHLPCTKNDSVSSQILEESSMTFSELEYCFNKNFVDKKVNIHSANFMLFNTRLFSVSVESTFFKTIRKNINNPVFTTLIDFRDKNAKHYLEIAYSYGVRGLKFHSYIQTIENKHLKKIIKLSLYAQKLGMFIAIDASYGSLDMYRCNNLSLVCEIARKVKNTPVIILHSGGARVIEAMLLADSQDNIFLETSFSMHYLKGSTIENDFSFAYKKIGVHKVLYGSDFPYINIKKSIAETLNYFQKHNFSSSDIEMIMYDNAESIRQAL